MRGAFDELMRGRAADVLRQRNRDGFAQDQAVRRGKIVRHVLFVNFETIHHVRQMSQRAGSELRKSPARVSHSACQPPSPRSCSWTIAVSMTETSAGTRIAAASTTAEPTGLRLCGRVEEPPRPDSAGSRTSPTSVCASREISRAIFPSVPTVRPMRRSHFGEAVAMRVPGNAGQLQFQFGG